VPSCSARMTMSAQQELEAAAAAADADADADADAVDDDDAAATDAAAAAATDDAAAAAAAATAASFCCRSSVFVWKQSSGWLLVTHKGSTIQTRLLLSRLSSHNRSLNPILMSMQCIFKPLRARHCHGNLTRTEYGQRKA